MGTCRAAVPSVHHSTRHARRRRSTPIALRQLAPRPQRARPGAAPGLVGRDRGLPTPRDGRCNSGSGPSSRWRAVSQSRRAQSPGSLGRRCGRTSAGSPIPGRRRTTTTRRASCRRGPTGRRSRTPTRRGTAARGCSSTRPSSTRHPGRTAAEFHRRRPGQGSLRKNREVIAHRDKAGGRELGAQLEGPTSTPRRRRTRRGGHVGLSIARVRRPVRGRHDEAAAWLKRALELPGRRGSRRGPGRLTALLGHQRPAAGRAGQLHRAASARRAASSRSPARPSTRQPAGSREAVQLVHRATSTSGPATSGSAGS